MSRHFLQIGPIKAVFGKLAKFLRCDFCKFRNLSLAGILKAIKCLKKHNWLAVLKTIKLIVEIVEKIRTIKQHFFCKFFFLLN